MTRSDAHPSSHQTSNSRILISSTIHDDDSQYDNETVAKLQALRKQEDYGAQRQQPTDYIAIRAEQIRPTETDVVNATYRARMVEWCYQVAESASFRRETVEIAVSYLDRYLSLIDDDDDDEVDFLCNRKCFQLLTMTCLHVAIKLHESDSMEPRVWANLTRGSYQVSDITTMEFKLLCRLQWRMVTPTAYAFCHYMVELLGFGDPEEKQNVLEAAMLQIDLSVKDYGCVTIPASTVALAALLNALELENEESETARSRLEEFAFVESPCVLSLVQERLFELVEALPESEQSPVTRLRLSNTRLQKAITSHRTLSPRGVSTAAQA